MKLSTKSRYALEGLLYMAVNGAGSPLSVKEIAAGICVSAAYMEQIFFSLKKDELVLPLRGAKGGFVLGRSENEITVGSIIRAIDGSLVPVACVENLSACTSKARSSCVSRGVWVRISAAIAGTADHLTLKMLKDQFIAENGAIENENIN
jgi:Rrf2 family protein